MLSAISSLLGVLVLLAASIAAILQLKDLRLSNQLTTFVHYIKEYNSSEMLEARAWVEAQDFSDPVSIDAAATALIEHRARMVGNFLNGIAQILNAGVIDETKFSHIVVAMPIYWKRLAPVAKELRRRTGLPVWIDMEYVVYRYATDKSKLVRSSSWPFDFRNRLGIVDFSAKFARIATDSLESSRPI